MAAREGLACGRGRVLDLSLPDPEWTLCCVSFQPSAPRVFVSLCMRFSFLPHKHHSLPQPPSPVLGVRVPYLFSISSPATQLMRKSSSLPLSSFLRPVPEERVCCKQKQAYLLRRLPTFIHTVLTKDHVLLNVQWGNAFLIYLALCARLRQFPSKCAQNSPICLL